MDNDLIIKRIRAANIGKSCAVSILYNHINNDGSGALAYVIDAGGKGHVQQIKIKPNMAKAMKQGRRNRNLDNLFKV